MAKTDHFRAAHNEILQAAEEVSKLLNLSALQNDAAKARGALSKLAGKLKIHLLMEDNSLFPSIEKHSDEKLKATLKRFVDEMGGIKEAFDKYTKKWATPDVIKSNAAAFISESKTIFSALAKRIEKENNELYRMIDALH